MKAILPNGFAGGMNLQQLAQQAQQAQEQMQKASAELEAKEYTASAGGSAVEVTVNGKGEIVKMNISPEIIDPEETEMLTDMIIAAVNEAHRKAGEDKEKVMEGISGGLNLPGLF